MLYTAVHPVTATILRCPTPPPTYAVILSPNLTASNHQRPPLPYPHNALQPTPPPRTNPPTRPLQTNPLQPPPQHPPTLLPFAGRVLDIGTGCGIWAAEFASTHPGAEVVGIDNFPQPHIDEVPANCRFLACDAEDAGQWEQLLGGGDKGRGGFDVIHTRLVPFHIKEVEAVLGRCYEYLKPGGWIEMQEAWPPAQSDEPGDQNSKVIEWTKLRLKAAARLGIDQGLAGRLPEVLARAGLVDVQVADYKWLIGPWLRDERMRRMGEMNLELLREAAMGLSKDLLMSLGMEEREVEEFVEGVRRELGTGRLSLPVRVVWGRKPEEVFGLADAG